jgi:hypothetical protein
MREAKLLKEVVVRDCPYPHEPPPRLQFPGLGGIVTWSLRVHERGSGAPWGHRRVVIKRVDLLLLLRFLSELRFPPYFPRRLSSLSVSFTLLSRRCPYHFPSTGRLAPSQRNL